MARTERAAPNQLPGWPDIARLGDIDDPPLARAAQTLATAVSRIAGQQMSASTLAGRSGVTERTVRRVLGRDTWPDLETLMRLLSACGLTLTDQTDAPVDRPAARTGVHRHCTACRAELLDEYETEVGSRFPPNVGIDELSERMRALDPRQVYDRLRWIHDPDVHMANDELTAVFVGSNADVDLRLHAGGFRDTDCDVVQWFLRTFSVFDLSGEGQYSAQWPPADRWVLRDGTDAEQEATLETLDDHDWAAASHRLYPHGR